MQSETIYLLIVLFLKHNLADFVFQTRCMSQKSAQQNWLGPLALHCAVHAVLTFVVICPFFPAFVWLVTVTDYCLHFLIDYWKAQFARYPFGTPAFWWTFGLDQFLHAMTYVLLVYLIVGIRS